jgi:hypothetical protein
LRAFQHRVVALQAERVADKFQRDVIVAPQPQPRGGVELTPRLLAREPDFP